MSATARLNLPYIAPLQAQKQVTYNEAMAALDQLVQPSVKSRTTAAPPGSPAEGDTYIVATGATGAWAGKDGKFACWLNGAWSFRAPADGWLAYVVDAGMLAVCQSGAWSNLVLLEDYVEGTWTPALNFGGAAVSMTYCRDACRALHPDRPYGVCDGLADAHRQGLLDGRGDDRRTAPYLRK